MRAKLLGLLKIYEEEISLLLWTAGLLFVIRSSGIVLNNYAETAFLKRFGVEYIPIVNMLNAVATFLVTGIITALLSKMSGARLLTALFLFSGILATAIRLLIPFGFELLYPLLFMLKSQFELLQAMLFWNLCNDLFNTRQSKRLFPLLTAGGVVGLILGSLFTPYFAKAFNLDNLLYLYFFTTLAGAVLVELMGTSYPLLVFGEKTGKTKQKKPSFQEEMKKVLPLIKESLLIKIVLVLTFMPNVVIPIINYQFSYAVNDQFASEAAMIEFFGYFRGGLYAISLFILLFVGRIYGRWGLPVALMFHPFNYMVALFAFLFRFDLFSAMYARMSTNIIRTTINMPANSILIGLFPESYRKMIRPFLRGTVVRAALFTGSTLILLSAPLFHPRYLTLVALPFMIAWAAAPFVLKWKYSAILLDLISKNFLDIKRFDNKELKQIFNQEKTLSDLERSFLAARGDDAVWYARLLQNFLSGNLDRLILENLDNQDEATQVALIKMLSNEFEAMEKLVPLLDPQKHELSIAILKRITRHGFKAAEGIDLSLYITSDHPVVRGFAAACLYHRNPDRHRQMIDGWLDSQTIEQQQSGVISAGLSRERQYIPTLLAMLAREKIDPIIPDILIALRRLKARELNRIIGSYLSHEMEEIRLAALDVLEIEDERSLEKAVLRLGDKSDSVRDAAMEKIESAAFQNNKVLVESLGLPNSRIRRGIFKLLETLDIKEFDVLLFARKNLNTCYDHLAMAQALGHLPGGKMSDLAVEHLLEKKELMVENIVRVLALHDQTGKMKMAWRGIFSSDSRHRANAIELLNDILDRKTFNAMLPLLESPTPATALAEAKGLVPIPKFSKDGNEVFARLVSSPDWVDVVMGLGLALETPSFVEGNKTLHELKNSDRREIVEESKMVDQRIHTTDQTRKEIESKEISLGEKILLLKEIEIFSGLSAAELAAIANVTKERDYPADRRVIRQGDVGETVFLIIEGKVHVIMEKNDGMEVVIDHIHAGGAFGEMALIDDSPRSATIQTVEPCRFLLLHKQEFKETALEFPGIALQICSVLSKRIRHLHAKVQEKT